MLIGKEDTGKDSSLWFFFTFEYANKIGLGS